MTQAKIKKSVTGLATFAGAAALVVLLMRANKTAKATGTSFFTALKTEAKQMFAV